MIRKAVEDKCDKMSIPLSIRSKTELPNMEVLRQGNLENVPVIASRTANNLSILSGVKEKLSLVRNNIRTQINITKSVYLKYLQYIRLINFAFLRIFRLLEFVSFALYNFEYKASILIGKKYIENPNNKSFRFLRIIIPNFVYTHNAPG